MFMHDPGDPDEWNILFTGTPKFEEINKSVFGVVDYKD